MRVEPARRTWLPPFGFFLAVPAATRGQSEPITEDLSVPPHTMKSASRDAVDKLRLDGAPTPRSWVARMKKRLAPTGAGKSAPVVGGQREGVS
jgi:hypothetical protein